MGFAEAAELVGYIQALGVSHLYLSPALTARPGSTHGYDVADPATISRGLGGERGLRELASRAHAAGIGLVLDLVPNHLGTGFGTQLWRSLLAEGAEGIGGRVFDVDFQAPAPGSTGKVVLPVLGQQYGKALHAGELSLVEEEGEIRLAYFDHRFPVSAAAAELVRENGFDRFAGTLGRPDTWSELDQLLDAQAYRLIHWRAGQGLVNYRRFFSIDDLAAVRVEDEQVFDLTHTTVLRLIAEGVIDGLRIDHPDGLRDPARYLERLAEATGGAWTVVEKITARGERLPAWSTAGTTGYELMNELLGLFVDPSAQEDLDRLDAEFGGDPRSYLEQVEAAKREVLGGELAPDLRRVVRLLWPVVHQRRELRDCDDLDCSAALTEVIVSLDVYRTYADPVTGAASREDLARVETAVAAATQRGPRHLYPFLRDLLTGRVRLPDGQPDAAALDVMARVQQLSGALMAKGVEDTVFYRYRRLLAVNEVGGDPSVLGLDVEAFHALAADRAERHPLGMTSTATHDTKRGEDARLRIAALSEIPARWASTVRRWHAVSAPWVTSTPHGPAPDPQTELLTYQTLVSIWPLSGVGDPALRQRVQDYLVKAGREAKQRTSWRDPEERFETGVARWVDRLFDDDAIRGEVADLASLAGEIAMVSGLAQVLLRCTLPGVPDIYQGTEDWQLVLVDPDNRRPVDFAARRQVLEELDAGAPDVRALWSARADGRVKTWVLSRTLRARQSLPGCFGEGSTYEPLAVSGRWADHVIAFRRSGGGGEAVVIAPRLPGRVMEGGTRAPLGQAWDSTTVPVPSGPWIDALSGSRVVGDGSVSLSSLFGRLPVALLLRP